jgi:uncharacterized protein YqeY
VDIDTLRQRLQTDLLAARKRRHQVEVAAIRSLLSALANAEAVPVPDGPYRVVVGRADVPRRILTEDDVAAILQEEIDERRSALASHGGRAGSTDLAAEVVVLERYRSHPDV